MSSSLLSSGEIITMEQHRLSWDPESETFSLFDAFNLTETMGNGDTFHPHQQPQQPFDVANKSVGFQEDEGIMRHSTFWTIVLVFAYVAVFLIGIVGNAMVISVLTMKRQMRTVTNLFILNLAIADMSVVIFCVLPTLLANIFVPWLLGSFMCKAVAYVQGVSVCASVYSLVAISLDRFLAIMFPMKMPRGLSTSQARVIILFIWVAASCITFPWLIAFRVTPSGRDNDEYCVESWPESMDSQLFFLIGNLVLCYGLPLTIISISNGLIWRRVAHRKVPQDSASTATIKRVHRKTRHGVLKMLTVVTLTFLISWLPLYLIFLRIKLGGPLTGQTENLISITMPFAQWLGAANSCCNPILYAFLNQKFRDSFKSLITCPPQFTRRQNPITLTTFYSNSISTNRLDTTPRGPRKVTFRHPIHQV